MRRPWAGSRRRPACPLAAAAGVLAAGLAGIAGIALFTLAHGAPAAAGEPAALTAAERAAILALGPWPLPASTDPDNPASGRPAGIALGEALFHSPRLSPTGLRCASCHEPWRHFADGRTVAQGVAPGSRNTPSLLDAARHRHYGWDGARASLWRQCLRPLEDAREMPASAARVAALVRGDALLAARHAAVFGGVDNDDARVLREVGLALAAYVETLATPRASFDDWRDALASAPQAAGPAASDAFPAAARRGLRLFVGRAGCAGCHAGPTLGDDALHASRVHAGGAAGVAQAGRDDAPADRVRTPGLRDVAATAPYFHDGSAARLCDAVQPHAADPGAAPTPLTAGERRDLVAFLRTLSADAPAPAPC